jgi:superfamily II DNA or RNA helicase
MEDRLCLYFQREISKNNLRGLSEMEKIKVVVVAGPTASGKTSLGVEIAKKRSNFLLQFDKIINLINSLYL